MSQFYTGITTGIIASTIIAITVTTFKKVVLPFIKTKLSKSPIIEGKWEIYYDLSEDAESFGDAIIKQTFDKITGKVFSSQDRSGIKRRREYKVQGKFCSGILTFIYEDTQLSGYVLGVGLLKLSLKGEALIGKVTYVKHDTGKIETYDFALRRPS